MSCTARTWRSRAAPRPQARSRKGARKTRAPAKVRAARAALRFHARRGEPDAPPGGYRIACEMSHSLVSFDQVLCIAYAPLPMLTFAAAQIGRASCREGV